MKDFKPGVIQSPGDPRDFIYRAIVKAEKLPAQFSRRDEYGPVRDQGRYGACVGFASAAVKDNQESRNYSEIIVTSPLFIYATCKKMDGIPNTEGTYPRVAMKVLKSTGVCEEKDFPYSRMEWPNIPKPDSQLSDKAGKFKIGAYARVQTIDEVKQAIVRDGPVLAGVLVCENFLTPDNGYIDLPEGKVLGGHAICVIGYNDTMSNGKHIGFFEVRNSWGKSWGDKGYCWIPYDFFESRADTGMSYWFESWSSVDIILPPPTAKEVILWIDKEIALVDGKEVYLDQPPVIDRKTDRTLIPLRFLSERMGYLVQWDGSERKITLQRS